MERLRLSKIIDFVVKSVLIFLISFVWIRFYLNSLYLSLVVAVAITLGLMYLLNQKQKKENSINNLKKEELEKIDIYATQLLLYSEKEVLIFFSDLVNKKHTSQIKNGCIVITSTKTKTVILPMFNTTEVSLNQIITALKKVQPLNAKRIIFTANCFNKEAIIFCKQIQEIDFSFLNKKECYMHLFKEYNYYPEVIIKTNTKNKVTKQQLLQIAFNKGKTKSYIFSGIIIFLASFIVPYNIYYVVISSVLFLMALFSYFNVFFNKKPILKKII